MVTADQRWRIHNNYKKAYNIKFRVPIMQKFRAETNRRRAFAIIAARNAHEQAMRDAVAVQYAWAHGPVEERAISILSREQRARIARNREEALARRHRNIIKGI